MTLLWQSSVSATSSPSQRPERPTVIVTDANHAISVPFVRSLAQSGWRVVAASHEADGVGLRSRYVSRRIICPSPGRRPAEFVTAIGEAARRTSASLVMPLSETTVVAINRYRDQIPAGCQIAVADGGELSVALEKRRTIALARELGVPVPRTAVALSVDEVMAHAREMRPPFVVKPSSTRRRIDGRSRLGTLYARDIDELAAQAARLFPDADGVLLQEWVPGHGVGVNLLMRDGSPLLAFQHRRLRELPIWGGASALRESVALDAQLYRDATAMLGALRWTGLAMVEFRVDGRDYRLMEINGRAWGSMALAVAAGVDFPSATASLFAADDAPPLGAASGELSASHEAVGSGQPPSVSLPAGQVPYRLGVRSRSLQLDVLWIASVLLRRPRQSVIQWPSRRAAMRAILQLLDPRIRNDVLSLKDPRPGAQEILHVAHYLIRHLLAR